MRAIHLPRYGPPEVLTPVELPEPTPGPGAVTVRVAAAGVQFLDTQLRAGSMSGAPLPVVPGKEVAGEVVALGPGTDPALLGARVLASTAGTGGYAERAVVPVDSLVPVPVGVGVDDALAAYRYGVTADGLVRAGRLRAGDRVLVLAAAGAIGTLLVQLASRIGATVVGAAGSAAKRDLVADLGADHTVNYRQPNWPDRVRAAVDAIDVVYDHVGGTIGRQSFDLLAPDTGRQVVFGRSSGSALDVPLTALIGHGLTVTGFSTGRLWREPDRARDAASRILARVAAGEITPVVGQRFPLGRAADAHAAVEARATLGKTLLIP